MVSVPIGVLASGRGSNFVALAEAQARGELAPGEIRVMICNRPKAAVIDRARERGIEAVVISHRDFDSREAFDQALVDVAEGTYPARVDLEYTHNGNDGSTPVTTTDSVTVQTAPDISIVSIIPSQPFMTADQTSDIQVDMEVRNSGQATVQFTMKPVTRRRASLIR